MLNHIIDIIIYLQDTMRARLHAKAQVAIYITPKAIKALPNLRDRNIRRVY